MITGHLELLVEKISAELNDAFHEDHSEKFF